MKLFEAIYYGEKPNVQKFIEKYKDVELQKEQIGYEFPHLKVQIDNMKDKEMKKRLLDVFEIIEREF